MQCSYKSENPTPFMHIGTQISFTLMAGHNCDSANSIAFLKFLIVPLDVLLPPYASCGDFAAATFHLQIEEVEQNFECFFFLC